MNETKSLAATLRELKVGESLTFPYKRLYYIRQIVTFLNGSEEKRYSSRSSAKTKTIEVIRTE